MPCVVSENTLAPDKLRWKSNRIKTRQCDDFRKCKMAKKRADVSEAQFHGQSVERAQQWILISSLHN